MAVLVYAVLVSTKSFEFLREAHHRGRNQYPRPVSPVQRHLKFSLLAHIRSKPWLDMLAWYGAVPEQSHSVDGLASLSKSIVSYVLLEIACASAASPKLSSDLHRLVT
eukprot:6461559-Amphidinium_carterae.2